MGEYKTIEEILYIQYIYIQTLILPCTDTSHPREWSRRLRSSGTPRGISPCAGTTSALRTRTNTTGSTSWKRCSPVCCRAQDRFDVPVSDLVRTNTLTMEYMSCSSLQAVSTTAYRTCLPCSYLCIVQRQVLHHQWCVQQPGLHHQQHQGPVTHQVVLQQGASRDVPGVVRWLLHPQLHQQGLQCVKVYF